MSFTMPKDVYCTFDKNCLGVECCVSLELSFLTKTYKIWINMDPCSSPIRLSLGVGMNSYQFDLLSSGYDSKFYMMSGNHEIINLSEINKFFGGFIFDHIYCLSKRMYNFYYENLPLKSGVGGDIIVNDTLDTSLGGIAVMLK